MTRWHGFASQTVGRRAFLPLDERSKAKCPNSLTPRIYDLAVLVHLVALLHFSTEMIVFKTVKLNRASFFPFVMSSELRWRCWAAEWACRSAGKRWHG